MEIAVIGAGLAGLTCARRLADAHTVTVFEKSRGVGGRMATRYTDVSGRRMEFDHGVASFSARTGRFGAFMDDCIARDAAAPLAVRGDDAQIRYIGRPRMNAIARSVAAGLDIRLRNAVLGAESDGSRWTLVGADGPLPGAFDWLIATAPAPQTARLLPAESPVARRAAATAMTGRFTLMLGFGDTRGLPDKDVAIDSDIVSAIVANSARPGRPPSGCLVVHSTTDWAERHLDAEPEWIESQLFGAARTVTGADPARALYTSVHRWRYATVREAPSGGADPFVLDPERKLGACGDWLADGRAEGAWLSGYALAAALDR